MALKRTAPSPSRPRRANAQLTLGAGRAEGAAQPIGALEGGGGELAVEALEACALGAVGAVHGKRAVDDLDRVERNLGGQVGGLAEHLAEALPVPAVAAVERQAQDRPLQLDLVGLDHAADHRGYGELDGKAVGAEKRLLEVDGRVGNAHLLEAEIGGREQVQVDRTAHPDLAAEQARGLLLEHAAIAVPVDEIRNGEQRTDDGDQKDCDGDDDIAHPPTPPAGWRGRVRSDRGRHRLPACRLAPNRIEPSLRACRAGKAGPHAAAADLGRDYHTGERKFGPGICR